MRLSSTLLAILLATTAHAGVISTGDNTFPTDPDQFRIGLNGVGSWTIDGGSAVTMRGNPANIGLVPFTVAEPFLIVGRRPGSNGTVLIDGAGSRLDIVAVGSNPAAPNMDGAGAQSLFVVIKTGRKLTLIGFLIKLGQGVVDAWAMTDLTRRRADELLDHMRMEADAMTVSAAYIETRLADALADKNPYLHSRLQNPYQTPQVRETAAFSQASTWLLRSETPD